MGWIEFIAIGWTFWFITPTLFVLGILFYSSAYEKAEFAVIATLVYIVLIQICSDFSIFGWIGANKINFIKYFLGYLMGGVLFAGIKYWCYLIQKRRDFDHKFIEFLQQGGYDEKLTIDTLPSDLQKSCMSHMKYVSLPTLSESTRHIVFWMGWWPIVGVWTLINNPLKWFWEEMKHQLGSLFKGMHQRILGERQEKMREWRDSLIAAEDEERRIRNEEQDKRRNRG